MSGPYHFSDLFDTPKGYEPLVCNDPDCQEDYHEEVGEGEFHHYGCECGWCQYVGWTLK